MGQIIELLLGMEMTSFPSNTVAKTQGLTSNGGRMI